MLPSETVPPDHDAPEIAVSPKNNAPRLLVIDDDVVHRSVIMLIAERAGYRPIAAGSVGEAAERLDHTMIDALTLDLSLGRETGIGVLHALSKCGCRLPIIIISAASEAIQWDTVQIARSYDLHVHGVVPKPVDLAVLRETLRTLRRDRLQAPAA